MPAVQFAIFALLKFAENPQTFRFCCHWRAENPKLVSCGCPQCYVWAAPGHGAGQEGFSWAQHSRIQADLIPWEGRKGSCPAATEPMSWSSLLGTRRDIVQIPSRVTWDFSLWTAQSWGAAAHSPPAPVELEFSVLGVELSLLSAGVLWAFSLDLSRFSQPPLEQCSWNGNSALRAAFPLFCVRNFC